MNDRRSSTFPPNQALQVFMPLIGAWKTVGAHGLIPAEMSQRYTLTISQDGQTLVGKGEMSRDGATWEQDLDLTYSKVRT